ncbi:MAG: insulinase family protein [Candidatus Eisenbacteria sp.]|nr:insulinase family protein [Candidatus Eisenbacteria bacterium]
MDRTFAGESLRRTVLDNGIRVVTERVEAVRSVSLGVWVQAGSRDECSENAGISHFLEHVVFKGTEGRSAFEIARALESVGGGLDAFTTREHTCYLARVLGDDVPLAVEVISDLLRSPALVADDIEMEKQVVIEEIRSLNDLPDELAHESFTRMVWHDHPLKNSILGTEKTVASFTPEKMREYMEGHYIGERIVVAAAGWLDHDEVVDLVKAHVGSLAGESAGAPDAEVEPFRPVVMGVRDLKQEHIYIGCRGVSFTHPDRYAMALMVCLLGGGMSSRLYQSVRERSGLAYAISSYAEFLADSGLFGTYIAVSPENATGAIRLILKEMALLKTDGLDADELDGAKAQIVGGIVIGMERMSQRMGRLAKAEIHGEPIDGVDAIISGIRSVTADDVIRVLDEGMRPGRICLAGLGPLDETAVSDIELIC